MSGSYTWQITNNQSIYNLLNASVGESFESDVFEIGKLKWVIVIYPNGWNKKNKGHLNVCLKLLSMTSKWRQLIICRTIQCLETMSSCTAIATYHKNGDTMCWKQGTLLLSELFQVTPPIQLITFKISINILKITCKKNKQILYPNIKDYENEYKQQQYIIWKIDNQILNKFRLAYHSKSFESKKYENKMWCIRCYPNGISSADERFVGLYLTLCALPPQISKIKVLYTFRCKEFKNLKHSRIKNFSYGDKSSWGVSRFFEFVQLHKLRSLTFYVDITIMNEYDDGGKEILPPLKCSNHDSFKYATTITSQHTRFHDHDGDHEDIEEEKVNHILDSESTSLNCVLSSSRSATLDNRYNISSIQNNNNSNNSSDSNKIQYYEIVNMIKKETSNEIEELQKSYNVKLNSLCAIVEQIQINNDTLSNQTRAMMSTVNDVCSLMQKERNKLNNTKDIEIIRSELATVKDFILHNTQKPPFFMQNSNSTKTKLTYETLPLFEDDVNNEVILWLRNDVKMPQYIDNFITNGFEDLCVIKELSINELDIIGIKKLGHKMKILQHIRKLWKKEDTPIHINDDIFINMTGNNINYRSRSWQQDVQQRPHKSANYRIGLLGDKSVDNGHSGRIHPNRRHLSVNGIKRSKTIVKSSAHNDICSEST